MKKITVFCLFVQAIVFAETAEVRVKDINASRGKAIVISEGNVEANCVRYDLLEGKEEVFGAAEYDKSKAYGNWKSACSEWKATFKDLNKENRIISMNCNSPTASKEGDQHSYKSMASYKVRVKMSEKQ